MSDLASKIKTSREALGLSKAELARRAGVSAGFVGNLESGFEKTMSQKRATALAEALGLNPTELIRLLPKKHVARVLAETEVPDYGMVWGSPPRDVPDPEEGKTYRLTGRWPAGTFVLRVSGHSVHRYGVHDGDVIAVEPTDHPQAGRLVIARQGNAYTLKGCWDGKLWSFGKEDEVPKEMDGREPYQVAGVMLGIVDGERRFTPAPKVKAVPPKGKANGKAKK